MGIHLAMMTNLKKEKDGMTYTLKISLKERSLQ
jgi:hypothetical protein